MIRTIMSEVDVVKGLKCVLEKIEAAAAKRPANLPKIKPKLVAASKTKPVELITALYNAGHHDFGENYVQELVDKAHDPEVLANCRDIRWHFIGHLQRNKVNKVVGVPGIYLIESVDSNKLATALDAAWQKVDGARGRLKVLVQVNTSCEEDKSGCKEEEAVEIVKHVLENCRNLHFVGLMTIGKYGYDPSQGPNPDFLSLLKVRHDVCQSLALDVAEVELSMGMSNDYEQAVEMGSTYVRVGTAILGHREEKQKSATEQVVEKTKNMNI